jgi:hypothetical protein
MTESIARAFRARYLDTHEKYLDSIATLVAACNDQSALGNGRFMLSHAVSVRAVCTQMKALNRFDEARALRNLRNCWYHECALNHPLDFDDRMRFAPWKIIQFFYTIYSALSSVVRCFDNRRILGQGTALDEFTSEVIINPPHRFVPAPLCFYLRSGVIAPLPRSVVSWPYGLSCHVPNVQRCLESVPTTPTRPVSLFHYFKSLREWANYEDSYIFINLFGPSVISRLARSLYAIVSGFLPVVEVFLISFYGWDRIHPEFLTFSSRVLHHLKTEPTSLSARFGEYAWCSDLVV